MAKMFKIGEDQFTASQYLDAHHVFSRYVQAYGVDEVDQHVKLFLHGVECTGLEFKKALESSQQAWLEKKLTTHVYKKVLYGDSNTYVWAWIPKK